MKNLKNWLALASIPMALTLSAQTAPADPLVYNLAMTLSDNGETIAEPKLSVRDGELATVSIDKGDGRTYHAEMSFTANAEGTLDLKAQIDATSPTLGTVSFAPQLKIREGEPVRIEHGNRAPGVRPLRIEIMLDSKDG